MRLDYMTTPSAICRRTGKKMFHSPVVAERRRKDLKRKRNERLSSYRCRFCRKWHIGHPSR